MARPVKTCLGRKQTYALIFDSWSGRVLLVASLAHIARVANLRTSGKSTRTNLIVATVPSA